MTDQAKPSATALTMTRKLTNKELDYSMRLHGRIVILRERLKDSQLRDNQEITKELHALEWAVKELSALQAPVSHVAQPFHSCAGCSPERACWGSNDEPCQKGASGPAPVPNAGERDEMLAVWNMLLLDGNCSDHMLTGAAKLRRILDDLIEARQDKGPFFALARATGALPPTRPSTAGTCGDSVCGGEYVCRLPQGHAGEHYGERSTPSNGVLSERDPGNVFGERKLLSVRINQIRNQWLNISDRQKFMLGNLATSAEWLEEKVAATSSATEKPDPVTEGTVEQDAARFRFLTRTIRGEIKHIGSVFRRWRWDTIHQELHFPKAIDEAMRPSDGGRANG